MLRIRWNIIGMITLIAVGMALVYFFVSSFISFMSYDGDKYVVENVKLVKEQPATNTTSDIFVIFKNNGGTEYKLYMNEDNAKALMTSQSYNVTYKMNAPEFPNNYIVDQVDPVDAKKVD